MDLLYLFILIKISACLIDFFPPSLKEKLIFYLDQQELKAYLLHVPH